MNFLEVVGLIACGVVVIVLLLVVIGVMSFETGKEEQDG